MIEVNETSPKLKNIPVRKPRQDVVREGYFLQVWQQHIKTGAVDLNYLVTSCDSVRQRAASVAASFVTFMGCNCGMAFTHKAEQLSKQLHPYTSRDHAFLMAWAIENQRVHYANHRIRTIEAILRSEDDYNSKRLPVVTQADIDVVESMIIWWSTPQAQAMRDQVEAMADMHRAQQRATQAAKE